jgi:hypothetical protein
MNVKGEVFEGETCEEGSAREGPQESSALEEPLLRLMLLYGQTHIVV